MREREREREKERERKRARGNKTTTTTKQTESGLHILDDKIKYESLLVSKITFSKSTY